VTRIQQLPARVLRRALLVGIQRVGTQRTELNRINVFPVPDNDTGTNLAFTLGAVREQIRGIPARDVETVFRTAATEAIDNARGNSGAILAHFLHGAAEALKPGEALTASCLATLATAGTARARAAVAAPCEGTILSVMQAFSTACASDTSGDADLRSVFGHALVAARTALQRTRGQLKVLRAAGVVDAGAMGFVELLEGIADYAERGRAALDAAAPGEILVAGVDAVVGPADDPTHRFCVQCVVQAESVDRGALKADLLAVPGSRLVLAGTRGQVRAHAHVADPARWFAAAARSGTVVRASTEDLASPSAAAEQRHQRVAIVADSGADIPAEALDRLDLHLVPVRVSLDGRDLVDGVTLTPREFYDAMRASPALPRTSQPPPGDFRRMFEYLLLHHAQVIDVSLGGTLSGALQSATGAAARTAADRISVFDSRHAAAAQGLLAIWAAEAAQAGLDAPRILAGLERMRPRTALYGAVRDIRYGVQGGRVPRIALPLTRWLRFSVLARNRADGRLGLMGGLWGRAEWPERFARRIARRLDPSRRYRLIVGHCDSPAEAERVAATLRTSVREIDRLWLMDAGVAIGAHAGPGSLLIAVQDYEAPQP